MTARLGIIGGYLGSGKSTLVNRLLAGVLPGRTAVVVNDFGSINIDADLIASDDGDTIELTNGCICCQINDDAIRTMSALAARGDLDHVLCEVSGVGDPGQLALWRDFPGFSPGPLLVCADATAVCRLLADEYVGDTVARQFDSAEVVLVTKTDVASPGDIEHAAAACREAAPRARLVLQDAADPDATAAEALADPSPVDAGDAAVLPPAHHHGGEDHAETHVSATVEFDRPADVAEIARVLASPSTCLARAKGILQDDAGGWQEIQLAGGRVDVRSWPAGRTPPQMPALVLIAAGPDAAQVVGQAAAAVERVQAATTTATGGGGSSSLGG